LFKALASFGLRLTACSKADSAGRVEAQPQVRLADLVEQHRLAAAHAERVVVALHRFVVLTLVPQSVAFRLEIGGYLIRLRRGRAQPQYQDQRRQNRPYHNRLLHGLVFRFQGQNAARACRHQG
jgi:hypothetical protein